MPGACDHVAAAAVCGYPGSIQGNGTENISDGCVPGAGQQEESVGCLPDHKSVPRGFREPEGAGDGTVYLVPDKGQWENKDCGRDCKRADEKLRSQICGITNHPAGNQEYMAAGRGIQ